MRTLSLALLAALSIAVGAAMATLTGTGLAAAHQDPEECPNTWCGPGWHLCNETTGWSCSLSGGCSGTERC